MGLHILSELLIIFFIIATFGQLLFNLTPEQRNKVRRFENETKRLNNAKHAVVFNEICIKLYYEIQHV